MTAQTHVAIGEYLAIRLQELGILDVFAIPGDYNLALLDAMQAHAGLTQHYCCNELNAGYAADGYARTKGAAAAVVTYSVGGLSIINAAAGTFAEDLPVIFVSGAPNTNAAAKNRRMHHTLGIVDYDYVREMFAKVTVEAVTIRHPDEAGRQIDHALSIALSHRKPVYIEIASNIAALPIRTPTCRLVPAHFDTCEDALNSAVEHALGILNGAVKPVLVAGPKLRPWDACDAFQALVDASGYATAGMPNAKGFVRESQEQYIGTYWGSVSSPGCGEIVESADAYLFAGPVFTDYTTVGFNLLLKPAGLISVAPFSVKVGDAVYDQVRMSDFLSALAARVTRNPASLVAYNRIKGEAPQPAEPPDDAEITTRYLFKRIEAMLSGTHTVIAETGDSWFNGMRLALPDGCRFEIQMQYGSIGWSLGATLGVQAALGEDGRAITLIGDGSFQMTAQELSTLIRYGLKPIIFVMNNGGYTIEVEIHDGPYNVINNWDYAGLVSAFNANDEQPCLAQRARTAGGLRNAIDQALDFDGLCLIEVSIDRDDCNKNLLKWGSYVATANGEPPLAG
jgi:pyruvate decarboxylase